MQINCEQINKIRTEANCLLINYLTTRRQNLLLEFICYLFYMITKLNTEHRKVICRHHLGHLLFASLDIL